MIKYFCDICQKEINRKDCGNYIKVFPTFEIDPQTHSTRPITDTKSYDLCKNCKEKVEKTLKIK